MSQGALQLDPDFRRDPPRGKPCCAKCQRAVDTRKARHAWVNWNTWKVSLRREDVEREPADTINLEYIGPDCWKEIGLPP